MPSALGSFNFNISHAGDWVVLASTENGAPHLSFPHTHTCTHSLLPPSLPLSLFLCSYRLSSFSVLPGIIGVDVMPVEVPGARKVRLLPSVLSLSLSLSLS